MQKKCFKGIFNFARELHILYAYAHTERQAWLTFCRRLAGKHEVHLIHVMSMFDGLKDNFKITIEPRKETIHEKA